MKRLIAVSVCTFLLCLAGTAMAAVDWVGEVWPNYFTSQPNHTDMVVYIQVYKAGVTDAPGQGAGISAEFDWVGESNGGVCSPGFVAMTYNGDVGNNDEYMGVIAQEDFAGCSVVFILDFDIFDHSDGRLYPGPFPDQNGVNSVGIYPVMRVLQNEVDVTFTLCMSGEPHDGAPFLVGNAPVLGDWCDGGSPVQMTGLGGDLYETTVTFPVGTNPELSYKYQMAACAQEEISGVRSATLPIDGTTTVSLYGDSWNDLPLGCGLQDYLDADRVIHFYACLDGVENSGDVCIHGNVPELGGEFGDPVPMYYAGDELWTCAQVFPEGLPVPVTLEFRFVKDDCGTWETTQPHEFVLDNSVSNQPVGVHHNWQNLPGACNPVATETTSWGSLKSIYR